MTVRIRDFRDEDADDLYRITQAAIQRIGAQAYDAEQTAAWAAGHMNVQRFRERAASGAVILVAVCKDDRPRAYTLLEPDGHLDQLYTHPGWTGQGLALRLLAAAEDLAKKWQIRLLYTEASELAHPVFLRAGYELKHRRDFTIEGPSGPVPIYNYAMEKHVG
ncbi:GNAT family N-acetyltransferase [Altererythrobacter aurantiacus]|uniref:GNAT family N-acetyltransferase n=1 Tax=Parapontixanthobacter aurantiacus TaxID=1463599 RepID=A0A844ZDX8_9SPHN|nr:GNAT family N-acetyltransferase [Parapontixanthobacter aurantiacus]MXO85217.1 GNAT family N-acetyltransferase [Parapontixanthobacter aurantiacus]